MKITVQYPFHPFYGKELVVIRGTRSIDGAITISDPQGKHLKIPVWMTTPDAKHYYISKESIINVSALISLSGLLKRKTYVIKSNFRNMVSFKNTITINWC